MTSYACLLCSRTYGTPVGIKRHISEKHQYENIDEIFQLSKVIIEEPGLWDEDFKMNENPANLWDEDFKINENPANLWDEDFTKDKVVIIVIKINMIIKHN